jgi:tRNA-uridine 2-sulfurtransferase
MTKRKGRIGVAMSGGVDSSTAAALLQEEGYEVIGLTMHLWDPTSDGQGAFGRCCAPEDINDARRVCDQIGIPHYVINLRQAFAKEVVDYFVAEYLQGLTPNPCIRCNDRIKFHYLLRKAEELGAQALATGHYARIQRDPDSAKYRLLRGLDRRKDQSYFLFSVTQEQMAKIRFPLGDQSKAEVRKKALGLGLRVAAKSESQEICFIPDDDYRKFVESYGGKGFTRPGEIVNRQGKVLGLHQGIHAYTIGQRRGLGIAAPHPHYVLALELGKNRLIVGTNGELFSSEFTVGRINWVSLSPPEKEMQATVQIRYRHPGAPALLFPLAAGKVRVELKNPQRAITPGQAAVFYDGDEVLGGGWIEKTL